MPARPRENVPAAATPEVKVTLSLSLSLFLSRARALPYSILYHDASSHGEEGARSPVSGWIAAGVAII